MTTIDAPPTTAAPEGAAATFEVRSPVDGHLLTTLTDHDADAVRARAERLRAAQPEWEGLGPAGRAHHLLALRDWLLDNQQHLLDVMQAETGKVRQEAAFEPAAVADVISYYARHAERFLADRHPKPSGPLTLTKALTVVQRPYPLVGVISPWNAPLLLALVDTVPALQAGAAVLIKPSEVTPLSALEAARGWQEIGAPDVLGVIEGTRETGAAVVDAVDYVQFTGSAGTGAKVAQRAGERLIGCSLELGGKDAMIVLNDADLERAANGAVWGGFFNSGQVCVSVERIYVEDGIYDRFLAAVLERTARLSQGVDTKVGESEIGAMSTSAQVEVVAAHVEDARAKGARVLIGGRRGQRSDGNWFEPTVIVDVDHQMRCMREETFGPTLPIMRVRDAEEAIRLANDSSYGLSASVWTADTQCGETIARRLNAGAVNINDVLANIVNPQIPMAGWGQSGVGRRYGGADGLTRFCRTQAISRERIAPRNELLWYPYSPRKSSLAARVVRFAVARGKRRWAG